MDYRNLPFKFGYKGLNILAPPENLKEGEYSRFQNVRYKREGVLEARPGTEDFSLLMEQTQVHNAGDNTYPSQWDLSTMTRAFYIGKVTKTGTGQVDAWLTYHELPASPDGNSSGFHVFVNGRPIQVFNELSSCQGATTFNFNPEGFSVIRTYSKSGQPIIVMDGTHYFVPSQIDLANELQTPVYNYTTKGLTTTFSTVPAYRLSPPTPADFDAAATTGAGTLSGTYFYGITYYSTLTGNESQLTISADTVTFASTNDTGSLTNIPYSHDPQIDKIRIWRKGGTLDTWRLLTSITNNPCSSSTASYTDTATDASIAVNETISVDWKQEFTTVDSNGNTVTGQKITRAFGPFLGKYLFWVGDPVKKGFIYWSIAGDPSRYNWVSGLTALTDPGEELQNGFVFYSLPFVFSRLHLYALDFAGEDANPQFNPRLVSIGMGIAGKWAFAVGPSLVFYLGRDGIYATDCQPNPPVSLTETTLKPIFQGVSRGDIPAINWSRVDDFRMTATAKELHFFYVGVGGGSWYHLVYDFERGAWSNWTSNTYVNAYADEGASTTRVIFGALSLPDIRSLDDSRPTQGSESFSVVVRTGAIDTETPLTYKEYGVLQIDADLPIAMTIQPRYNSDITNGSLITILPEVSSPGVPVRRDFPVSLGDQYGRSISLEFTWTETVDPNLQNQHPVLYQGQLQFREDEEKLTHWEMPPTTLGQNGWFHLKDAYITLRSLDTVILTVVIDGVTTDQYNLASTSGERLTRYVEFKPRRGKVFQFKLDSLPAAGRFPNDSPFRFYGEDSMLRGKPWLTGASYSVIQPFGAAGYAEYLRKQGGT